MSLITVSSTWLPAFFSSFSNLVYFSPLFISWTSPDERRTPPSFRRVCSFHPTTCLSYVSWFLLGSAGFSLIIIKSSLFLRLHSHLLAVRRLLSCKCVYSIFNQVNHTLSSLVCFHSDMWWKRSNSFFFSITRKRRNLWSFFFKSFQTTFGVFIPWLTTLLGKIKTLLKCYCPPERKINES